MYLPGKGNESMITKKKHIAYTDVRISIFNVVTQGMSRASIPLMASY